MDNPPTKPCCQEATNRRPGEAPEPFTVEVCQVCGCRHFRLKIDLAEIFGRR